MENIKKHEMKDTVKIILITVVSVMLALALDTCIKGEFPFTAKTTYVYSAQGPVRYTSHGRKRVEEETEDEGQREYARLVEGMPTEIVP